MVADLFAGIRLKELSHWLHNNILNLEKERQQIAKQTGGMYNRIWNVQC